MNFLSFKYTKEDGTVSERVVVPVKEPTQNYFCVDVSTLDLEDQVAFSEGLRILKEEHNAKVADLMSKFDIKHNFRTFKPERMENIIKE